MADNKFEVSFGPKAKIAHTGLTGRTSIYPWDQMPEPQAGEDGEPLYSQFFVPGKTTKQFSGAAQNAGKRMNATFTVRSAEEDGVAGVLVQRIEYRKPAVRTDAEKAAAKAKREAKKLLSA